MNESELKDVLIEFGDLWMANRRGETQVKHSVKLLNERQIRQKLRQWSPNQQRIIYDEVEKMISGNVVREVTSTTAISTDIHIR